MWSNQTYTNMSEYERESLLPPEIPSLSDGKLNGVNIEDNERRLKLVWDSLSLKVTSHLPIHPLNKYHILRTQSGSLESGQLTAVIGPSGAGKTSLLKILAGVKYHGVRGNVYITTNDPKKNWSTDYGFDTNAVDRTLKSVSVVYIGQSDHLIQVFTVQESLNFASKLKNSHEDDPEFHNKIVKKVMSDLGLTTCSETQVTNLSGGQIKRLSFALELVSSPHFMILDEPTSGLDSSSAAQTVQVLNKMTLKGHTSSKVGIIASIHQPSAKVLFTFQYLYILSSSGDCIYNGPTTYLLSHFSSLGLNCPSFHNPADFAIEVASGDLGPAAIDALAKNVAQTSSNSDDSNDNCNQTSINAVIDRMINKRFNFFYHLMLLVSRCWISTARRPLLCWLRLLQHVALALMGVLMYKESIGESNGCFSDLVSGIPLNVTTLMQLSSSTEEVMLKQQKIATDNATQMYYFVVFLSFANMMPTVLTFPLEMVTFLKERRNAWYSTTTYFLAHLIADTPFQIVIPFIYCIITWLSTGQIPDLWRFSMYCLVCILLASITQAMGTLVSIICISNVNAAVSMSPLTLCPFFLVGGFFVNFENLSIIMKPVAALSFIRYTFESIIVVIYGFDRCSSRPSYIQQAKIMTRLSCFWASREFGDETLDSSTPSDFNMTNWSSSSDSWMSMVRYLTLKDLSSDQSGWISSIVDVSKSCVSEVIKQLQAFLGATDSSVRSETMSNKFLSGSYMMTHWQLDDSRLWFNIPALVGIMITVRLSSYIVMLLTTNRRLKNM